MPSESGWWQRKNKQRQLGADENHVNPTVGKDQGADTWESRPPLVSRWGRGKAATGWREHTSSKALRGTLGIWKCLCPAEKPSRSQLKVPTSAWSTSPNSPAGVMVPMSVLALVNSLLPSCWARNWDTIQTPGHGDCLTLSNTHEASRTPDILRLIKGQPCWSRSIADVRMSPEILGWPLKIASG